MRPPVSDAASYSASAADEATEFAAPEGDRNAGIV